jgi:predicted dehydrogenase
MVEHAKVKIAIIGVGAMGSQHTKDIYDIPNAELAAVCDTRKERADQIARKFDVPAFYDHLSLLEQADMDSILIATPHYDHPTIAMDAFERGIHVLIEKPIAVHVQAAKEMIQAYQAALKKYPTLVFAAMFQQRTYGYWKKIKSLISDGELGKLVRTTWIITDWFRTQSYYDNGGWRATWKGEGGGVLLNQCPHNIDLFQWLVGMPNRVTGFASIGKYHKIEVEDEVTAYLEYDNGMVGHFITSTGESPGTNRLEIVGEMGKLIFENNILTFYRNRYSMLDQIASSPNGYEKVENWQIEIPYEHHGEPGHRFIIENFINVIETGEAIIAPAAEGFNSLLLGNAIIYSSFQKKPVDIPFDAAAYADKLKELAENSSFTKNVVEREVTNMQASF